MVYKLEMLARDSQSGLFEPVKRSQFDDDFKIAVWRYRSTLRFKIAV